jgi:hypothetical protein
MAVRRALQSVLGAFESHNAAANSGGGDPGDLSDHEDDGTPGGSGIGGTATASSAGATTDSQKQSGELARTCRNVFKYFSAVCSGGVLQSLPANLPVLELLCSLDAAHRTFAVPKARQSIEAANACAEELYQIAKMLLEKDWTEESSAMLMATGGTGVTGGNLYTKDCVKALVGALVEGGSRRRDWDKPFEAVGEVANEIVSAQTNKFFGVMYPGLTKSTLHYFYSGALSGLVKIFRALELGKLFAKRGSKVSWKSWVGDDDIERNLDHLHWAVTELQNLVLLTKVNDRRVVLSAAVKEGYAFVELFKSTAMPFLSAAFNTDREAVLHILANLQTTTRQLRSLCAYGKQKKDVSLMRATPALKRSLETLIYQAKLLCTTHNCLDLFKSGVLKRRNIDGSAQVEEREESSAEESDNEEGASAGEGDSQSDEESSSENGEGHALTKARKRAVFGSDDDDEDDEGEEEDDDGDDSDENRASKKSKVSAIVLEDDGF